MNVSLKQTDVNRSGECPEARAVKNKIGLPLALTVRRLDI